MATNDTILIVDDEPKLARSLALILQRAGYGSPPLGLPRKGSNSCKPAHLIWFFWTSSCQTKAEYRYFLTSAACTLTCRCLSLPPMRVWRQPSRLSVPVQRDYLLKPIDPEAIVARVNKIHESLQQPKRRREITTKIQALLEELHTTDGSAASPYGLIPGSSPNDPARFITRGDLSLDLHTRHVFLKKRDIPLAPSTFDYLVTLMRHSPQPVPYDTMVLESQGYQGLSRIEAKEITRWQVHELRKALEEDARHPQMIITVRDVGYRLVI